MADEEQQKPEKVKKPRPEGKGKAERAPKKKGELAAKARPPARLWGKYRTDVVPQLKKELNLKSVSQVPRLQKVVINMGLGEAITNNKVLEIAVEELGAITGQKAVVTKSKKAISNFKLRENIGIGAMVTLRRAQMWEFTDRLISIALPRLRDFKGVSDKAFDGRGNYTLGLREQIIFPEIEYDRIDKVRGMNISFVTTAGNDEHARALLAALGMPFRKRGEVQ